MPDRVLRTSRTAWTALLLPLLLVLAVLGPAPAAHAVDNAHIRGTVTGPGGAPLENVDATVYRYNAADDYWEYVADAYTDATGAYDVADLPAGTFHVGFDDYSGNDYRSEYYDNQPTVEAGTNVTLTAGQIRTGINAQLSAGASISGTVTGPTNVGLGSVEVTVYTYDAAGDYWEYVDSDYTASNGTYTIAGLAPGNYHVGYQDYSGNDYLGEYYSNKPTVESGNDIVLTADQVKTGINAKLTAGASIAGTVTNSAGTGLAGITVTVYQYVADGDYYDYVTSGDTIANGTYKIAGLAAGTYRIGYTDDTDTYSPEFWNDKPDVESANDIVLAADAASTGKNAVLITPSKITGTVTSTTGTALSGISVTAYRVTNDGPEYAAEATTGSTGAYSVNGLAAGTYRLAFDDDSNSAYISEYYNDKPSLGTANDIAVPVSSTVSGRNAQLAVKGTISGKVTNAGGTALGGIQVTAYSAEDGATSTATTASDGTYTLRKLDPGGYRVGFADPSRAYAPVYFGGSVTRDRATRLAVAASQSRTGKNATLVAGSHLTGTVRNNSGTGLSGIQVIVWAFDGTWHSFSTATTSSGAYDVKGLAARTYRLEFSDPAGTYEGEYWNNQALFARSTNIGVGPATTVSGKDAKLDKPGTITGKVTNGAGTTPIPGVTVTAYELSEGNWQYARTTTTSSSGTYTISGLRPTTHRVCFSGSPDQAYLAECWQNAASLETGTSVSVPSGSSLTGIDGTLAGSSRISGTVTDSSATPVPIGGASVTAFRLVGSAWQFAGTTSTVASGADAGRYTIKGLVAGTYRLYFRKAGFVDEYWSDKPTLATANNIVVAAATSVVGKNAALAGAGHITGTVTDAASAGLTGVDVTAYRLVNGSWVYDQSVTTASGGGYDLAGLQPGTYRLEFEKGGYLTEYWNDKATLSTANDIVVASGATVSGRNAALASGGRITGTVTNASGAALGSVYVEALQNQGGSWVVADAASTDAGGVYSLTGLATGNYRLQFAKDGYATEYYNDKLTVQEASDVAVTSGNTTSGRNAALALGGRVIGTVTDADAVPLPGVGVTAYRLVGSTWIELADAYTDLSGRYELEDLPAGTIRIGFEDDEHTTEYWNDKSSVETADNITVTAGATNGGKDAVLTTASRVTGRVTDSTGAGIPGVDVTLYQAGGYVASATANGQGYYDLGGVVPGSYTLGFEDPDGTYAREYWNDQAALATANAFSVGSLSTVTKDAGLDAASHLTGTLTSSSTGLPIVDDTAVQVYQLVGASYTLVDTEYTRDTGLFLIDGLHAGTYKLGFVDYVGHYVTEYYDDQTSLAAATAIPLAVGQRATGKNAQLAPVP